MVATKHLKTITRNLLVTAGMMPLMSQARTQLSMPEREHVQTIVWIMEAATFISALVIVWFLWRVIKRDQAKIKAKRESQSTARAK